MIIDDNFLKLHVGASVVSDDSWDLRPLIKSKNIKDSRKTVKFGYIKNEDLKYLIKQYAYHKIATKKGTTVVLIVNGRLPCFVYYCRDNGIDDFSVFSRDDFLRFALWLKETKKLSSATGASITGYVSEIIKIGQIKGWKVPQGNVTAGLSGDMLWGTKKERGENKVQPIPENIFNSILEHAIYDEEDTLTKAGIIIQSQTGLRISEVLSIQEGCLHKDEYGHDYMEVRLEKTEKGDTVRHRIFVNDLVVKTVKELSLKTKNLRIESGFRELFLIRSNRTIVVIKAEKWTARRLKSFVRRWDIRGDDGALYNLKSHQFRATYVKELVKQKVPLAFIMKQYSHVSIEMTAYYLTLKDEEIREIYADMILSPESGIAGLRAGTIRNTMEGLFRGKAKEEINEIVHDIGRTMSFNPLPNGVCLYDFRRGNCTDGDGCFFYNCPNYVTSVEFYPVLKKELDLMEEEMARLIELGRTREWQRRYIKYKYLKPLVDELEAEIEKKNAV